MTKNDVQNLIKSYNNFPEKGIIFRDISPILSSPPAFEYIINNMCQETNELEFNKILAIDARGFIFASALAYKTRKGLVMCRKPSKLPGKLITINFGYEYASTSLSVQKNVIKKNDKILIVDDVLATGNTTLAAYNIVVEAGGKVSGVVFPLELKYLNGRKLLMENFPDSIEVLSILKIDK